MSFAQRAALELGKKSIQFGMPIVQPFYHFRDGNWIPVVGASKGCYKAAAPIRLITWNIDFAAPAPQERMAKALEHLGQMHSSNPDPQQDDTDTDTDTALPSIILLQEMTESDLQQIQQSPWIQQRFFITDLSDQYWLGLYGTTTLVDKRFSVQRVFRVLYPASTMQRDGLFVDVGNGSTQGCIFPFPFLIIFFFSKKKKKSYLTNYTRTTPPRLQHPPRKPNLNPTPSTSPAESRL